MLRNILLALGALIFAFGLVVLAKGYPGSFAPLLIGGLIVVGTLFERVIYKRERHKPPGPEWSRTTERFVDPQTGATLTIYEHPATGERAYVKE